MVARINQSVWVWGRWKIPGSSYVAIGHAAMSGSSQPTIHIDLTRLWAYEVDGYPSWIALLFRWFSASNKLLIWKSCIEGSVERLWLERHFCLLLPYFSLSWLQIFQLCFSFWTSFFVLVFFLRQDPLELSFWSFLTFLHHGIEEVERHHLWKFYNKIRRKSWSTVTPKLLACIGFLYKVVHKIGRLRKFNRSREIEFNFLTAWTISMKFGTLVQHAPGYKRLPQIFYFCLGT